jgi:hypothetical protein
MGKNTNNSKLIKLSLVSLIAIGSVSGVYLTYQQKTAVPVALNPVPAAEYESGEKIIGETEAADLPLVVEPETVISPQEAVEKRIDEMVISQRTTQTAPALPSRSQTVSAANSKTAEQADLKETEPAEEPKTKPEEPQAKPEEPKAKPEEPQTKPEEPKAKPEEPQTKPEEPKAKPQEDKSKYDTTLNSYVLDVIKTYTPGQYPYLMNRDYANYNGVTFDLYYRDKLLLKAHPSGKKYSHCSGITFEVFFRAMQERNKKLGLSPNDFKGMSYDQLYDFVMNWYVADGNKQVQNVARAVEKYGIGKKITSWEAAKAGDFIDISRENNTGHTVVFINWLRDKQGRIIGFKYWSSQESTKGISYKEEYFNLRNASGVKYGNVMTSHVYIARVSAVRDYR